LDFTRGHKSKAHKQPQSADRFPQWEPFPSKRPDLDPGPGAKQAPFQDKSQKENSENEGGDHRLGEVL